MKNTVIGTSKRTIRRGELVGRTDVDNPRRIECKHQYFEIKKLEKHGIIPGSGGGNVGESGGSDGSMLGRMKYGVLVKCALCSDGKELWED